MLMAMSLSSDAWSTNLAEWFTDAGGMAVTAAVMPESVIDLRSAALGRAWFMSRALDIVRAQDRPVREDTVADLYVKAHGVVGHVGGQHIDCYCDRQARAAFSALVTSPSSMPWDLVELGRRSNDDADWPAFFEGDLRTNLLRFAQIAIDPSAADV